MSKAAARALRWFGIDRDKSPVSFLGERAYDISRAGYKYHLNDLAAAVGLGNLEDVHKNISRRRKIAARYRAAFKKIPGLYLLDYRNDRLSSYWLFTVLVERRRNFIFSLKRRRVPASVVHLRIDKNSVFGTPRTDFNGSWLISQRIGPTGRFLLVLQCTSHPWQPMQRFVLR